MQGDCNTSQPGIFDPKGRAKWSAWNGKKGRSGVVGAVGDPVIRCVGYSRRCYFALAQKV